MLRAQHAQHITHAVADRRGARAFYERVFGARTFFDGCLSTHGRDATLIRFENLCIELIDPPPDLPPSQRDYLERYGGLLYAITLRVDDVGAAATHLTSQGVVVASRAPHYLLIDPKTAYGMPFEVVDAGLPKDPGLDRRRASPGTLPSWSFSMLVDDLEGSAAFLEEVIGAMKIGSRPGEHARASHHFGLGSSRLSVMTPREDDPVLSAVMDRLGGPGIHSVPILVEDLEAAAKYLRGHGIGLMGSTGVRMTTHPRSTFGARILFLARPGPDDPGFEWLQSMPAIRDLGG